MRRQKVKFRQAGAPRASVGPDSPLGKRRSVSWPAASRSRAGWLLALVALAAWSLGAGASAQDKADVPAVFVNKALLERLARESGGAPSQTAPEPTEDLRLTPGGQLNSRLLVSPGPPAAPAAPPPAPESLTGELKALTGRSEKAPPPIPRRKAPLPVQPPESLIAAEEPAAPSSQSPVAPDPAETAPPPAELTREAPPAAVRSPAPSEPSTAGNEDAAPPPAELTREVPAATDPVAAVLPPASAPEPETPPGGLDPGEAAAVAPERTEDAGQGGLPAGTPEGPTESLPAPSQAAAEAPPSEAKETELEPPPQPSAILSALEQASATGDGSSDTPSAPAVPDPPAPPDSAESSASFDAAPPPPPPSALPSDLPTAESPPSPDAETRLGAAEAAPAQLAELTEGLELLDETRLIFDAGSIELSPEARAQLERLAEILKGAEADSLLLRAYASGRDARRLSLNRALVARAYLGTLGISSKRVVLRPLGDKAVEGSSDRVDIERLRR